MESSVPSRGKRKCPVASCTSGWGQVRPICSVSAFYHQLLQQFSGPQRDPLVPSRQEPIPTLFLLPQLVLDSQKRVFSWGFGGYGRLGHAEQKDEMVPRLVKLFDFPGRGASQIYAGYTCSFAVSEVG